MLNYTIDSDKIIIQIIQKKITMKKNILVVIALLVATITFATEAPKAVKEAFAKKFPTAKSVKWKKKMQKNMKHLLHLMEQKCLPTLAMMVFG